MLLNINQRARSCVCKCLCDREREKLWKCHQVDLYVSTIAPSGKACIYFPPPKYTNTSPSPGMHLFYADNKRALLHVFLVCHISCQDLRRLKKWKLNLFNYQTLKYLLVRARARRYTCV